MDIIIASASKQEAITNCVINNTHCFEHNISVVLLSDILLEYGIFDELNDSKNIIAWYENNKLIVSNETHLLLNRVLYFDDSLFLKFKLEDKDYARREFEAYIGFSFNSFSGVSNQNSMGLCENPLSLPNQWKIINNNLNLKTPNYYWGLNKLSPLKGDRIVQSDIYDFLNWRINKDTQEDHIFCFEKPEGNPVFCFVIGGKTMITSDIFLSDILKARVIGICKEISRVIPYFIYEVLFFYDGTDFIFGCVNPEIIRSVKNKYFDSFVIQHLISEFMLCLS